MVISGACRVLRKARSGIVDWRSRRLFICGLPTQPLLLLVTHLILPLISSTSRLSTYFSGLLHKSFSLPFWSTIISFVGTSYSCILTNMSAATMPSKVSPGPRGLSGHFAIHEDAENDGSPKAVSTLKGHPSLPISITVVTSQHHPL